MNQRILAFAKKQQRLARERAQREREQEEGETLIDDSIPVFDRGRDVAPFPAWNGSEDGRWKE